MKNKKKVITIAAFIICGVSIYGLYSFHEKICREVPDFVRMHGLRKSIRYMKGIDVWEEIYNEIL